MLSHQYNTHALIVETIYIQSNLPLNHTFGPNCFDSNFSCTYNFHCPCNNCSVAPQQTSQDYNAVVDLDGLLGFLQKSPFKF